MMCGLTGTPGTGKSEVGNELARRGHTVVHLVDTIRPYVNGEDKDRDTRLFDMERWAADFRPVDGFVEGHFAHLLPCNLVVVLRCRPDELVKRLSLRKYPAGKIRENADAEALDVCLIETVEEHAPSNILELDTTGRDVSAVAGIIETFVRDGIPAGFGSVDWSAYIRGES